MFERANEKAGTGATLHSLRHTAAYRMAEDPSLPLTDVQFVLGHAQLATTQIYLTQVSGIASDGRGLPGSAAMPSV
jgi:integrase